jgi:hypothetical protein
MRKSHKNSLLRLLRLFAANKFLPCGPYFIIAMISV